MAIHNGAATRDTPDSPVVLQRDMLERVSPDSAHIQFTCQQCHVFFFMSAQQHDMLVSIACCVLVLIMMLYAPKC